ncbi:uncharacterized protein LOC101845873 [Aplysia californica]|uniref:Uncharacterized protein LOC101845873 n=1 Tax=Aplysia californica TaxID=6500 RepID=A0ABM1A8A3_APLCA|nr:uncharacterized protein LOC101845873 [Aplysia californica]
MAFTQQVAILTLLTVTLLARSGECASFGADFNSAMQSANDAFNNGQIPSIPDGVGQAVKDALSNVHIPSVPDVSGVDKAINDALNNAHLPSVSVSGGTVDTATSHSSETKTAEEEVLAGQIKGVSASLVALCSTCHAVDLTETDTAKVCKAGKELLACVRKDCGDSPSIKALTPTLEKSTNTLCNAVGVITVELSVLMMSLVSFFAFKHL